MPFGQYELRRGQWYVSWILCFLTVVDEVPAWGNEQKGAFVKQIVDEVCRKRDVLFVTSAGNSGPALTTVGAPAAAGDPLFSIGAWVSESMQAAEYAMVDPVPSSVYTWSSRGPLFDGAQGVTCYAPGAAITSIPVYTLKSVRKISLLPAIS